MHLHNEVIGFALAGSQESRKSMQLWRPLGQSRVAWELFKVIQVMMEPLDESPRPGKSDERDFCRRQRRAESAESRNGA